MYYKLWTTFLQHIIPQKFISNITANQSTRIQASKYKHVSVKHYRKSQDDHGIHHNWNHNKRGSHIETICEPLASLLVWNFKKKSPKNLKIKILKICSLFSVLGNRSCVPSFVWQYEKNCRCSDLKSLTTDISHLYYKLCWLRAAAELKGAICIQDLRRIMATEEINFEPQANLLPCQAYQLQSI